MRYASLSGFTLFVALLLVPRSAAAQIVRVPNEPTFDVAVALALNDFKDVNVRPVCEELALPCGSPKTFPDSGVSVAVARYISSSFALAAEIGVHRNAWESWDTFESHPRASFRPGDRSTKSRAAMPFSPAAASTSARGVMVRFELDYCIMRDPRSGPRSLSGARSLIGVVIPLAMR